MIMGSLGEAAMCTEAELYTELIGCHCLGAES